jgi:hypothetical protein
MRRQQSHPKPPINPAEAKVRRALVRSGWILAIAALMVLGGLVWKQIDRQETAPVPQAEIALPDSPPADRPQGPPHIPFSDISREAGIDFVHVNGAYGERLMPETIGSGLVFFDYDRDGDQDLLFINASYWPGHPGETQPRHALYANDGRGRFEDVTEAAGLAFGDYGMGVAVGDYDGDGWLDLYLTNLGQNRLLHNQGGRFFEATKSAGVGGAEQDWSSSAAFFDYDRDGDLDLFVVNYVKWSRQEDLEIDFRLTGLGRAYGAPNHFHGANNRLYRNEGDGSFSEVSHSAGILVEENGSPVGKGLGVSVVDYDRDGWLDLIVANDTVRNFLYHNLGDGGFEEIGAFEGIAFDRDGKATGAMGIDSDYFRNDRELGVFIGNFANEMSSLFVTAEGRPPFADEAVLEGLGPDTRLALTFGVFFFDSDLDGRLDLLQANGHLEHEINKVQPSQNYAQPAQLFWNCGEACRNRFLKVTDAGDLSQPMVGRGAAYADIDGDGDLDVAINQNGRRGVLLRNDQSAGNHWLRVKLKGRGANPDGIGASLELSAAGITQTRRVMPARSFMSQVELPVTFGLGRTDRVDGLTVTWPDGTRQEVPVGQVDRLIEITQQP